MPDQESTKAKTTGPTLNPGDEGAPGTPGVAENTCRECGGTGKINAQPCQKCGGTGIVQEGISGA